MDFRSTFTLHKNPAKMSIHFLDQWNLKMVKLNWPINSPHIRVFCQSEHASLWKSNMSQKKSDIFVLPWVLYAKVYGTFCPFAYFSTASRHYHHHMAGSFVCMRITSGYSQYQGLASLSYFIQYLFRLGNARVIHAYAYLTLCLNFLTNFSEKN